MEVSEVENVLCNHFHLSY